MVEFPRGGDPVPKVVGDWGGLLCFWLLDGFCDHWLSVIGGNGAEAFLDPAVQARPLLPRVFLGCEAAVT